MTTPVLKLDQVRKTFGSEVVLEDITFTVPLHTATVFIGASGSGKSTLAMALLDLLGQTGAKVSGEVEVLEHPWFEMSKSQQRSLRSSFQVIFQDPFGSLSPRMTVGQIVGEGLSLHQPHLSLDARKQLVIDALKEVGLDRTAYSRYPHEFSGGQRQRLAIARCLAVKPELIIADEIVSALDVSIQAQIVNLLRKIQKETGLSFVFITHDVAVARYVGHRIAVMYLGSVVEILPAEALPENAEHPYTIALLSAVPDMNLQGKKKQIALQGEVPSPIDAPSGCAFSTRCPYVMDICKTTRPTLRIAADGKEGHQVACHLETPPTGE